MWQSWVEDEHYSTTYFNHVAAFKVLYQSKGGLIHAMQLLWVLQQLSMVLEVQGYSALNAAMQSNNVLPQDYRRSVC